jgi:hypothetical protein
METRTEQAAKMLMCPLLTTPGTRMKCQGSECMAWRWDAFEGQPERSTGRCAMFTEKVVSVEIDP